MSVLDKSYFHDEAAAFAHVEAMLWADGRACPHCGTVDNSYPLKDAHPSYRPIGAEFAAHEWVDHSANEYMRGTIGTNTVEGFYSIFKRGMKGVYQHCSEKHLHRYLAEFDFRYSNRSALGVEDQERAELALKGVVGKRLTYRQSYVN